ncbi:Mfa1 family fimbria major subunit [Bacteroides ndongoniae]|uniref:Mfa1 family fimbria major subunit n=1 Tax=Bacteroides ndongoniae TaxID=1903262 RepID=UPI0008D9A522|nr:Mfa1 family fimbria major subunit [Bacteroides ndongoniae]
MMKKVIYAFLSCFALLLTGGCQEQNCVEEIDTSHARNSLYLNLSLRVNDGSGAASRATDEDVIPGTGDENTIHSLYIYLFNSETGALVYWADITNLYQADNTKTYAIKLQDINLPEKVSIYLAANLTRQQAESITSPTASYKTNATSYTRAINEFAPYEFMPQFGVTGISKRDIGIAMTGQAVSGSDKVFDIHGHTSPDKPLALTVDLKRVVAKALLTVVPSDDDGNYAVIASGNEHKGWVRISDIYYFPNGTNKSLYWFEQENNKDPNSDLTDYISSTGTDTELALNTENYQNDFVYYNQTEQYKLYYAYYQAQKFDQRIDDSNTYTAGMYFLENTFTIPKETSEYKAQLENYKLALPMVTSISIALRYTPKEIYVEKGLYEKLEKGEGMSASEREKWNTMKGKYQGNKPWDEATWTEGVSVSAVIFNDEADAQFVLTMSLKLNEAYISSTEYGNQVTNGTYSGTKFPDNTFFAFTPETNTDESFLYHYYTYGARQNIENPIYYVPYVGGWAYYYTYLDGDGTNTTNKAVYSDSQVTRNTYYILKLNKITRLGGSKSDPNNIQVNTTVVPWKKGGRLDVDLW